MEIVIAIVAIIIGFVAGIFVTRGRTIGFLRVDRSDPSEEPYLFLELGTEVRTIMRKKFVTFKVKVEDFLPHE